MIATDRTVLAWKDSKAYLMTICSQIGKFGGINIRQLKTLLTTMGLNPIASIILDGSESTFMRVKVDGKVKNFGGDRYVYNMIKLINT